MNTNGSNPTDVFPGLLDPATWSAFPAEYQRLTHRTFAAVDQEGRFLCGGFGRSDCARSENYIGERLPPMLQDQPVFCNCHDVGLDAPDGLYVCQWNRANV